MNQHNKNKYLRLIIAAFVLCTIVFALFSSNQYLNVENLQLSFSDLLSKMINPIPAILIIGLTLFNLISRYFRWVFLQRSFNFLTPSRESFWAYSTSFIGNVFPLYIPLLIRLVPFSKHLPKAMLIFFLDILIEFVSVFLIFYFAGTGIVVVSIVAFAMFLWLTSILPPRGPGKEYNIFHQSIVVGLSLSFSILVWIVTSFALKASALSFGMDLSFVDSMRIFAGGMLDGLYSLMPAGAGKTGVSMIENLLKLNFHKDIAVYVTIVERALTYWFTIGCSILAFIAYDKYFLRKSTTGDHFDNIADEYEETIPDHIRLKYVQRKMDINLKFLPVDKFNRGLDAGCGQGWYVKEMRENGYDAMGMDYSAGQIAKAIEHNGQENSHLFKVGSITDLPYEKESFDFVTSVNIVHHLPSYQDQIKALQEVASVLKPGGIFILHEMNVKNPVFRLYMSYVFPLLKPIDEGIEIWIKEESFLFDYFEKVEIVYKTFIPDFLPTAFLPMFEKIEKILENNKLTSKYSAHVSFVLKKK